MAKTAADLTAEELKAYRRTAQLRKQEPQQQEPIERRERAWALARRASELLRTRFGASRVAVFGSLVHEGCFTLWSDVDVAVWGLRPADTFRAIGVVHELDAEIPINLIDISTASPMLRSIIEAEGVEV